MGEDSVGDQYRRLHAEADAREDTYTECFENTPCTDWLTLLAYALGLGCVVLLVFYVVYLMQIASCAFVYRYQCLELAPK